MEIVTHKARADGAEKERDIAIDRCAKALKRISFYEDQIIQRAETAHEATKERE